MVDKKALLNLMAEIMDPEIPVVNIVELGIVRGIEETTPPNIIITPTYVGCPATDVISEMVREKLDAAGHSDVGIKNQLSPAWTTNWMSQAAHDKLRKYGIDPPCAHAPTCPRCGSGNTKLISAFGSTPCKSFHSCKDCLEPFDRFKCH